MKRTLYTKECKRCKKKFTTSREAGLYCSHSCRAKHKHDTGTHNLIPGLGPVKRNDDWWKTFGVD